MSLQTDPEIEVIIEEGAIWSFLKQHGGTAFYSFLFRHFKNANNSTIEQITHSYLSTSCHCVNKCDELYVPFAKFAGNTLGMILDNSTNKFTYWTDEEKKSYFGLAPTVQYYLDLSPKIRKFIFCKSLNRGDVLTGRVIIKDLTEDFQKVHILTFADGRNYHISDLNIYMNLHSSECRTLSDGNYVNVAFSKAILVKRQLYCTTNAEALPIPTRIKLGAIEEQNLPLHYTLLKERPFNAFWSYFPNRIENRNIFFYENSLQSYNLYYDKIYSYCCKDLKALEASQENEIPLHKAEKEKLRRFWVDEARNYYNQRKIKKSLGALRKALAIDPKNVSTLLNRVAVYGNINSCHKAMLDVFKCLEIEPSNTKALDYFHQIATSQAKEHEDSKWYGAAAGCYLKLLRLPFFFTDRDLLFKFLSCVVKSYAISIIDPEGSELIAPEEDCQLHVDDSEANISDDSYDDALQLSSNDYESEESRLKSTCPWMNIGLKPKPSMEQLDPTTDPMISLDDEEDEESRKTNLEKACYKFIQSCSEGSPKKLRKHRHSHKHLKKTTRRYRHRDHAHLSLSSSPLSPRNSKRKDSHRSRSSSRSISSRHKDSIKSRRLQSPSPLRSRKDFRRSGSSSVSSRHKDVRHLQQSQSPSSRKALCRSRNSRSSSMSSRYKDSRWSRSPSPSRRLRREKSHRSHRSRSSSRSISSRYKNTQRLGRLPSSSPSRPRKHKKLHPRRSPSPISPPASKCIKPRQFRRSQSSSSSSSSRPKS